MNHDVMVSYAKESGKIAAESVVTYLEQQGIQCWMAHRDIPAATPWSPEITKAIKFSSAMLLILTEESNQSDEVLKEVTLAATHKKTILPYKLEPVSLSDGLEYHLQYNQWFDGTSGNQEKTYGNLLIQLNQVLGKSGQRSMPTPVATSSVQEKASPPAAPAWNLETPFASLIETHFAKFPDLIPLAKHITSGWTYGVEVQSQVGNYIELHTTAGLDVEFDAEDKEQMWMGLGIGIDGQSLVLLSSPSSCVSSYDDGGIFESDDYDSNTQQWLRLLGWTGEFVKNPTLLDAQGQELPMDECIGMVVPKSDSTRISESVAVIKNDAWEAQWIAENEREYDDNNLLDSCRVYLMEPMNAFLLRSPALLETFAVYFHEVCKGEKECNSKFSKNNDRFLSLNKKDMQPMDIYVDQVAHMSYLIMRKNGASISTPRLSDSKNIKTYLASAGWKWEILDQVTTREKGEAGETRVETDLVALPIKLYDVDYTAKVEALKRIVREYGADVQG